jgi:hypothetical protein
MLSGAKHLLPTKSYTREILRYTQDDVFDFQGATLFQYDGFSQACLVFKPHVFGFVMLFADKKRDA